MSELSLIRPAFYQLFNLLVCAVILHELRKDSGLLHVIRLGIVAGLLISAVGVVLGLGVESRAVGFFNNPNQLAYFSLVSLATILIIDRGVLKLNLLSIAAYFSGLLGLLAAASIAAILGGVGLILVVLVRQLGGIGQIAKAAVVALLALIVIVVVDLTFEGIISAGLEARYERSFEKIDDAYAERGFDRLVNNPRYLLFGAGEGGFERFADEGVTEVGELHSSLLTLLFSYGLPGVSIFILLLWRATKGGALYEYSLVAAVMTYHLTHMGLRFTPFWIFVVVVFYVVRVPALKKPSVVQLLVRP